MCGFGYADIFLVKNSYARADALRSVSLPTHTTSCGHPIYMIK